MPERPETAEALEQARRELARRTTMLRRSVQGFAATEVAPADLASVLWMVNLGTVRFHPWPVRAAWC